MTERKRPINETFQKRYGKKCMESAQSTSSKPLGGWRMGIDDGPARVLLRDADIFDAEPGACTPCVELDAWLCFAAALPFTSRFFPLALLQLRLFFANFRFHKGVDRFESVIDVKSARFV
jgi:hypothetical protein